MRGETLDGTPVVLPTAMPAERTVLLYGFKKSHQDQFDAWRPILAELAADERVNWRELPFLAVGSVLRGVIGLAMDKTLKDPVQRAHFAPIWASGDPTREALGVDGAQMVLVVCDRQGEVRFQVAGAPTEEAVAGLKQALEG